MEFSDPGFRPTGRFALDVMFRLPAVIREYLLFGRAYFCLPLQKILRCSLGGAFVIRARFTEGPLSARQFDCWSSEKYFMLGVAVERETQRLLTELVGPGMQVYDVGAHIGYTALLFSVLCGPNGHVFTFEPSPINFQRLKGNLELNPSANITPVQAAGSDKEGTVCFVESGSMSSIGREESRDSPNGAYVHTLRFDDFVYRDGNPAPDFVKIDTEGHAGPCLSGMQRVLRERRPLLVVEIHNNEEFQHVSGILQEYCYKLETIDVSNEYPRHIVARPF